MGLNILNDILLKLFSGCFCSCSLFLSSFALFSCGLMPFFGVILGFLFLYFCVLWPWLISIPLSSRSLICSSASCNLLLTPYSVIFILVIIFSSSDSLFFIFSVSLFKVLSEFVHSSLKSSEYLYDHYFELFNRHIAYLLHLGFFFFSCDFIVLSFVTFRLRTLSSFFLTLCVFPCVQ